MSDGELKNLGETLARFAQCLDDIKGGQTRHEEALVDLFKGQREHITQITKLDTVIRMSVAEQKTINERICTDIFDLENQQKEVKSCWHRKKNEIDKQLQTIERRYAYAAGAVAVVLVVLSIALKFW